jgi:D-alanyl-D-alanine dipeptidase
LPRAAPSRALAAGVLGLSLVALDARAEKVGTPTITAAPPPIADQDDPLVDAAAVVPGLLVSLAYATPSNITHRPLYPKDARCLLRKSIAARLVPVARAFAARGQRLVAWDCTRPRAAQEALFRAHPHPGSVADPRRGSLHQRGVAIDLALAGSDGMIVPLPTGFDAFGPRAAADAPLPDGPAKENRDALMAAMHRAGFRPNPKEWWHFSRLWGFRWPEVPDAQLWPTPSSTPLSPELASPPSTNRER